jgi:hypothetical protein
VDFSADGNAVKLLLTQVSSNSEQR